MKMYKLRKIIVLAMALSIVSSAFSGCSEDSGNSTENTETTVQTEAQAEAESKYPPLKIIYDEIKTEFGTVDLADYPITKNEVPADYESVYEAENGEMVGSAAAFEIDGASGGLAVNGVNHGGKDSLIFTVNAEHTGFYDFNFVSR